MQPFLHINCLTQPAPYTDNLGLCPLQVFLKLQKVNLLLVGKPDLAIDEAEV
jgi:hypothetical protein